MKLAEPGVRKPAAGMHWKLRLLNTCAVFLGALMLEWPALYNGFPVLYPDSMTYLADGRIVARAVFLHQFSGYYGMRSFFYSLGILPLHWNVTLWPVVAMQCLLTAYIVWLVVRSFRPRRAAGAYLILILTLSALTGMSWYSSLAMPDFLGPLLYLSIYLLVFARETVSKIERSSLYLLAWWAVVSHSTHLLLSGALLLVLAVPVALNRQELRRRARPLIEIGAVIALAVAAQVSLHAYLYGTPSLDPDRPPFLTARIIADGPGRWYLEGHCGERNWVICRHVHHLTDDVDNFLWASDGIVQTSSDEDQEQMLREEPAFVLATLKAYPLQQFEKSAWNASQQMWTFDFNDLTASELVLNDFNPILPRGRPSYVKSRQAKNELPLEFFTTIQNWTVAVSIAVIAVFVPVLWRRHTSQLCGLGVIIGCAVVMNAAVTGALSMVEGRFECRVIWLVPLLAGMCALDWMKRRRVD